jgi:hypothetical protein
MYLIMAYSSEDKKHIFDLFDKGLEVGDIENSHVPKRTLYRWFNEYQASNNKVIKDIVAEVVEKTIEQPREENQEPQPPIDPADWVQTALQASAKGRDDNRVIRERLSNLLLNKLEEPEINYRAVSCLSNAIACHSKLEREFGFYSVLDANIAIRVLESAGYIISNPSSMLLPSEE